MLLGRDGQGVVLGEAGRVHSVLRQIMYSSAYPHPAGGVLTSTSFALENKSLEIRSLVNELAKSTVYFLAETSSVCVLL